MATSQSQADSTRQPKRWRKYVGMTLKVVAIVAVLFALFTQPTAMSRYMNTILAVFLWLGCASIVYKHKQLRSGRSRVFFWRTYGFIALGTAVVLTLPFGLPTFVWWIVFVALFLPTLWGLGYGARYAVTMRKDADAIFTGELCLVASTLALVLLAQIGIKSEANNLSDFGYHVDELSYFMLAVAVLLLFRAAARRPDLIFDDEVPTPAENNPPAPAAPEPTARRRFADDPTDQLPVVTGDPADRTSHHPTPPARRPAAPRVRSARPDDE